ncbi:MAG: Hercynine oxygenase [Anaerolineales bacterium]|nr:Hercynine oxygenase [Anaerolineales bacterium]
MDITQLAADVAKFLEPFLPYLVAGGTAAAQAAGKKFGEAAWKKAEELWGKLKSPKLEETAKDVVKRAEQKPDDPRVRVPLELQLEDVLNGNHTLAYYCQEIVTNTQISAIGTRSVAAETIKDAIVVPGDKNVIGSGNIIADKVFVSPQFANLPVTEIPKNELLQAYYRALAHECKQLPLGIVDPRFLKTAGEDSISLPGIYIDLDVQRSQKEEQNRAGDVAFRLGEENRIPVLEALADSRFRRVVMLGDPGSGKTTCLHYMTYALSMFQLNETSGENLLPEDSPLKTLMPIRLVLREVAAQHIPAHAVRGTAEMIWNALRADIAARLGSEAAVTLLPTLRERILNQPCLILFDGLDEVTESDQKRERLIEAIGQFAAPLRRESYVLVTARPYAYTDSKWHLPGFTAITLLPFNEEQIQRFIGRWYESVRENMKWDEQTANDRGNSLAQAIQEKSYLFDLATRPLLLTLMSTLHTSWGKLPEDRADLYDETVRLLLDRWQRWREVRDVEGNVHTEKSISIALSIEETTVRKALDELAFNVHTRQGQEDGRQPAPADIRAEEVLAAFAPYLPDTVHPRVIIEYLETRAGLLIGRGNGIYSFPHRSFQEYLAACHLNDLPDAASEYCERIQADPAWWREVFLLGMGKMRRGGLGIAVAAVQTLVPALPKETNQSSEKHWQSASLAGQALVEMRLMDDAASQTRYEILLERIRIWLTQLIEQGMLTPRERAEAGDTLARLGDPRFDAARWQLPKESMLGFVHIPAGEFTMGTKEKDIEDLLKKYGGQKDWYEREVEQHVVHLPDFYMERYPVTLAQFKVFVDEAGYKDVSESALQGVPTHPVRYVTWFDALAYCNWLHQKLKEIVPKQKAESKAEENFWQGLLNGKLIVTLPSEAEWEKAARHSPLLAKHFRREQQGEGLGAREFPWQGEFNETLANCNSIIGNTSAVGCFPQGRSAYGLHDMAGNVWEWTRSIYDTYPYKAEAKRENLDDKKSARVLRGGAFYNEQRYVRCAYRFRVNPIFRNFNIGFRVVVASPPISLGPRSGS